LVEILLRRLAVKRGSLFAFGCKYLRYQGLRRSPPGRRILAYALLLIVPATPNKNPEKGGETN